MPPAEPMTPDWRGNSDAWLLRHGEGRADHMLLLLMRSVSTDRECGATEESYCPWVSYAAHSRVQPDDIETTRP
jgi:hypothetical protein